MMFWRKRRTTQPRIGLRVLSSPRWQGGVNYVTNWVKACAGMPPAERPQIWLLPFDAAGQSIADAQSQLVEGIAAFRDAGSLDLDMVFPATQLFEAPFGAPWAGWIPDWQCAHLPELFEPLERARRAIHYGALATGAPFLVLSSRMAVVDTQRLFPGRVTSHRQLPFPAVFDPGEVERAQAEAPGVRAALGVSDRYFLVANQWWRHKNHKVVLDALARLADRDIQIVFTGATADPRWPDYPAELLRALAPDVRDRIRVLGSVERGQQLALMVGCEAIVQPSLFEGWSTVVEEARTLGLPLLLSRIPVHVEQDPEGARYFDPHDADALGEAMLSIWRSSRGERRDLADRNSAFQRHCVRELCSIARATRAAYDPTRHDPALLIAEVAREMAMRPGAGEVERAAAAKFRTGARAMLSTSEAAKARLRKALRTCSQPLRGELESSML
jgi:glycosyltransferase involved in cell wall biosynthesis